MSRFAALNLPAPSLPEPGHSDLVLPGPLMISLIVAFSIMRTPLFTAIALFVGFGLGWVSRSATKTTLPYEEKSAQPPAATTVQTSPTRTPLPAATALPAAGTSGPYPGSTYHNRTETVRWLRRSGAPIYFSVLNGEAFSPDFGKALDLTPDEMTRLNDVVLDTKHELDAARLAHTTTHTSEDGKTLIVDVPTVDVSASRAAYDRLLETLKSTLGPERYEMFNELGGEDFERGFDQFGLNNVRYELVLQPVFPAAGTAPHYEYKRYFLDATGNGTGWGGSTMSIAQIEKYDPILARFLQSKLAATDGK